MLLSVCGKIAEIDVPGPFDTPLPTIGLILSSKTVTLT